MAAWRFHIAVQDLLHLDNLDLIQSVVVGLLINATRSGFLDPSGKRMMKNSIGRCHSLDVERQGRAVKLLEVQKKAS